MPVHYSRWYHRLRITNAYGQLIALIFLPIMILSCVGASLVLMETARSSRAEQRSAAFAILARYQPTAKRLSVLLDQPSQQEKVRSILQTMLNESDLLRVAIIDSESRPRISFGYGSNAGWPVFEAHRETFGPLHSNIGTTYGLRAGYTSDGPVWLIVDMDNQPLQLARYRVWLVLAVTGLLTLMLLLLCLNFYSRRWISPIYEIRLQLQRLGADTLGQQIKVSGTGELRLLQLDLVGLLQRLHESFEELQQHTEQTEDDLRKTLDALEIQNITYRKARDQAIGANQAKSVFLANISHELRTPLNSIDGFVNLMARKGSLSDQQLIYIQTIQKSSAHLLALVNDVLDFSKIDAGKLVLEQAPFDLEQAVFDVIDMLSPLACEKRIDMAVYYYEDMPRQVNGDALRFKQILTNLVSNAIKFTPDGDIIVRARLEDSSDQHYLIHVSVQDSGIGLTGADRKLLFESFSQGDPSVTRQYGGTGLGLAISRQLVHLMQGKIGFEDNQERHPTDKGATFWFTVQLGKVMDEQDLTDWPDLSGWQVLSSIQHPASANVLRGYLSQVQVKQQEAQSLPDLFGRLSNFEKERHTHSWVIVDNGGDTEALLREIRTRYHGALAVYGYQMALDPDSLKRYDAVALYEPMSRSALIAMLQHEQVYHSPQPEFSGHGLHVLAVDDHRPNLMVLEALLNDLGVEVTSANSGLEALELINIRHETQQPAFDLVFMDIQMPRMSGIEATQAIRLLEKEWGSHHQSLPIVALSAHVLSDEKDNLLAAGMNDYVSKPIQINQLIRILNQWSSLPAPVEPSAEAPQQSASTFYPDDFSPEEFYQPARENMQYDTQPHILDWPESLRLSAGKAELAQELLQMLVFSFNDEKQHLKQLIAQQDYQELEQRIHRMYGATRYIGLPSLQTISRAFEKMLMEQRKSGQPAGSNFMEDIDMYYQQLIVAMNELETEAQKVLKSR
ncbi:ATP-binding protein [Alkanindiges sp. WGS2144]|uniref:ATP-binding protein n=1 Tax=Alkanindiges sp. WGS2144 TaxID=3366808 RepID=UPI00375308CD